MQQKFQQQKSAWPWIMLASRTLFFALWQMAFAGVALLVGDHAPRETAIRWWPFSAMLGSLSVLALLNWLFQKEGLKYWSLFRINRATAKKDLWTVAGFVLLSVPIIAVPNYLSAVWLFGDFQSALDLLIRPLPLWVAPIVLLVFPVSIALSELPTYFAYCLPRLEGQTGRPWLAVLLPSLWLAAQHISLPLVFNAAFIAWRFLMFFPFALLVGVVIYRSPRLMPFLVIFHGLLDLSTALQLLFMS